VLLCLISGALPSTSGGLVLTYPEKIPIGGIKFSEERVHSTLSLPSAPEPLVNDLLQHFYKKQINIPFFCQSTTKEAIKLSFCVSANDAVTLEAVLGSFAKNTANVTVDHNIGSVTVFPHKNQLTFIAVVMSLMESLSLPVYSSCSSISAFVFNTAFKDLQAVASGLTSVFELPDNHAPFHPQFQLRQPRSQAESTEG